MANCFLTILQRLHGYQTSTCAVKFEREVLLAVEISFYEVEFEGDYETLVRELQGQSSATRYTTIFLTKQNGSSNPSRGLSSSTFEENEARQHMQQCGEQNFVMILIFAWRLFL
jgi:hypothetical protein